MLQISPKLFPLRSTPGSIPANLPAGGGGNPWGGDSGFGNEDGAVGLGNPPGLTG